MSRLREGKKGSPALEKKRNPTGSVSGWKTIKINTTEEEKEEDDIGNPPAIRLMKAMKNMVRNKRRSVALNGVDKGGEGSCRCPEEYDTVRGKKGRGVTFKTMDCCSTDPITGGLKRGTSWNGAKG